MRVVLLLLEDDFRLSRRALARALQARGAEVIVMTARDRTAECPERVRVIDWSLARGGLRPLGELRALLEVIRAYRALRPTLVHHVHLKPVLHGGVAAALLGIPTLHMINGLGYLALSDRPGARGLYRAVMAVLRRLAGSRPPMSSSSAAASPG